jgi:hypothetical protein
MKILSPTLHGYLDYVTVLLFLAAPTVIGLTGMAKAIACALAAVHFAIRLAPPSSFRLRSTGG